MLNFIPSKLSWFTRFAGNHVSLQGLYNSMYSCIYCPGVLSERVLSEGVLSEGVLSWWVFSAHRRNMHAACVCVLVSVCLHDDPNKLNL